MGKIFPDLFHLPDGILDLSLQRSDIDGSGVGELDVLEHLLFCPEGEKFPEFAFGPVQCMQRCLHLAKLPGVVLELLLHPPVFHSFHSDR